MSEEAMNDYDDLPPHLRAEVDALKAMGDDDIDCSDIPEITDFSNFRFAEEWRTERLLKLDRELILWFHGHRAEGEDIPHRIMRALREYVAAAEQDARRIVAK